MLKITLLTVGKLKNKEILALENSYLKRLKEIKLSIVELRPTGDNKEKECSDLDKKITELNEKQEAKVILLSEWGKQLSSTDLSKKIYSSFEKGTFKQIIFVIGGALGFTDDFQEKYREKVSLSLLTFPHQIARLLFIEQLYRSETIKMSHPYHH